MLVNDEVEMANTLTSYKEEDDEDGWPDTNSDNDF